MGSNPSSPRKFGAEDLHRLMERIEKESEMIDDHGLMIVGERGRMPRAPDAKPEEKTR